MGDNINFYFPFVEKGIYIYNLPRGNMGFWGRGKLEM